MCAVPSQTVSHCRLSWCLRTAIMAYYTVWSDCSRIKTCSKIFYCTSLMQNAALFCTRNWIHHITKIQNCQVWFVGCEVVICKFPRNLVLWGNFR